MRLSSLELQGFKSFPDKTSLQFSDGITAVVGPNGSGKSNIADAIRWVFGEQSTKTLRGGKMEDVIFSGTQTRKAVGYASVKLTIDNISKTIMPDDDQIAISRRLYRSGESEYRINGNMVRLKDVYELFLDTGLGRDGYSIIGQGRIADIISAKSNQRREIFEEAAGIAKFRYRRVEATKQLENAEENLLRLKDILLELEDRVGILKVQSEKAKKYIRLADEKKSLEISLWIDNLEQFKEQLAQQQNKIAIAKNDYNLLDSQSESLENQLLDIHSGMQRMSVEVDELRNGIKLLEAELSEGMATLAVYDNNIQHNNERALKLTEQLGGAGAGEEQLVQIIENKHQQQKTATEKQAAVNANIQIKKAALLQSLEEAGALQQELDTVSVRKNAIDNAVAESKIKQAANMSSIHESSERLSALKKQDSQYDYVVNECSANLKECDSEIESKEKAVQSLENSKQGYFLKLQSRTQKHEALLNKKTALEQDIKNIDSKVKILRDMETNMEGYYGSVRFILTQAKKGQLGGVLGAVSALISTDTKYVTAIETALGAAAQNLVVEDERVAKNAIELLKDAKAGRATFLPINAVKGSSYDFTKYKNEHGFIDAASKLVEFDSKMANIVNQILGRTCIVDDLNNATIIAKKAGYSFRIVTLDGQVINAGGSYTGGSISKSAGVLGRRNEIERLEGNRKNVLGEIANFAPELEKLSEELAAINAVLTGIDAEAKTAAEEIVRLGFEKNQLQRAVQDAQQNRDLAGQELENLSVRLKDLEEGKLSAEQLIEENSKMTAELGESITSIEASKRQAAQINENLREELAELQLKELETQNDIDLIKSELQHYIDQSQDAKTQLETLKAELEALEQSNGDIEAAKEQLTKRQTELRESIAGKNTAITNQLGERTQLEKDTTELRSREREFSGKREEVSREMVRLEERQHNMQAQYDEIIAKLWDEYELTRSAAQELAKPLENKQSASSRLGEVRTAIRSLGSVNLESVEEYAEVGERYEFLSTQVADVENAKAQLFKLIDELTGEMRVLFEENFEKISNEFSKIFVELFGGGQAELKLNDPTDVLESGIDITVQPPGKVIKNLSLLSGGEQAFVAITIYFAILRVKPAPFVMLDEIEAALDDVNVTRYANFLRTLADDIQFICITHRRGTMEEADVLYGVTMQENGISKLLELRVNELENKLGMGADI